MKSAHVKHGAMDRSQGTDLVPRDSSLHKQQISVRIDLVHLRAWHRLFVASATVCRDVCAPPTAWPTESARRCTTHAHLQTLGGHPFATHASCHLLSWTPSTHRCNNVGQCPSGGPRVHASTEGNRAGVGALTWPHLPRVLAVTDRAPASMCFGHAVRCRLACQRLIAATPCALPCVCTCVRTVMCEALSAQSVGRTNGPLKPCRFITPWKPLPMLQHRVQHGVNGPAAQRSQQLTSKR